jgi:hypothetical protein
MASTALEFNVVGSVESQKHMVMHRHGVSSSSSSFWHTKKQNFTSKAKAIQPATPGSHRYGVSTRSKYEVTHAM